jgi:hypothetical protein
MQSALEQRQRQLSGIDEARPARRTALTELDDRAAGLRDQLRAADAALRELTEGDGAVDAVTGEERRAFTRGRISATLTTVVRADDTALLQLQLERDAAARTVTALEAELDDEERMQLDSRLAALGVDTRQRAGGTDGLPDPASSSASGWPGGQSPVDKVNFRVNINLEVK